MLIKCEQFIKKIGNVIVSSPNYKVEDCYNKFLTLSNVDNGLPTMIIGLENAKKYIDGFSIFKREYWNNMLWWTFSKNEKRSDYDKDIQKFYEVCINNIINNIKYYNININELTYSKIKKLIKYIKNNNKKIYYIDNNKFVFIYDIEKTKNIYGISLNTCAFYGISKEKILKLIVSNSKNEQKKNFYEIPNKVRRIVNDQIPNEMFLLDYFN